LRNGSAKETTVTWDWIARGLVMGASGYAANCVRSFPERCVICEYAGPLW
jgi:hypothetical protein